MFKDLHVGDTTRILPVIKTGGSKIKVLHCSVKSVGNNKDLICPTLKFNCRTTESILSCISRLLLSEPAHRPRIDLIRQAQYIKI